MNGDRQRNGAVDKDLDWIGRLTYTPGGQVSAITANTNPATRPLNLGWPPRASDSIDDWALVGKSSFCFAGPFTVLSVENDHGTSATEVKGLIVHGPMQVTSLPSFMGVSEFRNFTITVTEKEGSSGKGKGKGHGNRGSSGSERGIELAWHLWLSDDGVDRADVYWRKMGQ